MRVPIAPSDLYGRLHRRPAGAWITSLTLIMMLSDAPRYVRRKKGGGEGSRRTDRSAEDEADDIVGFFQSRLE